MPRLLLNFAAKNIDPGKLFWGNLHMRYDWVIQLTINTTLR